MAACVAVSASCVADRPGRNGVFNENQYVKKSFLTRPADGSKQDNGWFLQGTITEVSSPNILGGLGVYPGHYNSEYVRFRVTQDKLQMLTIVELSPNPPLGRTENVINVWPVTNVDLKYRVNLDGERSNFYEENQELDWRQRQFVKINFAKNDMSDFAPLGPYLENNIKNCIDLGNVSTSLVPGSLIVDEANDYIEWKVSITMPMRVDNRTCTALFGQSGSLIGRDTETINLMYSLSRAKPMPKDPAAPKAGEVTYKPLELAEKDAIRHKYGTIDYITIARETSDVEDASRDPTGLLHSGQLAARQLVVRFDPEKPIVYYFEQGFPAQYKGTFIGPNGLADQTNAILADVGARARLSFKEWNDGNVERHFGDVRYNFLRYMRDVDNNTGFIGVAQFVIDPRTGETLKSTSIVNESNLKDAYVQRIDAYLKNVGASEGLDSPNPWEPGSCTEGQTKPLVSEVIRNQHNQSTLFSKMQQYMAKPVSPYGNLGPQDFIRTKNPEFLRAYYAWLPYMIFDNPNSNAFVIAEGGGGVFGPGAMWDMRRKETELNDLNAKIDRGENPYDVVEGSRGVDNATDWVLHMRDLVHNHVDLQDAESTIFGKFTESTDKISLQSVIAKDARHCRNGQWETKQQWVKSLLDTVWELVLWHEFGHDLGMPHNFMGSVDEPNYARDPADPNKVLMYSSSVMEYNSSIDRAFWRGGWAPYDRANLAFIYGNNGTAPAMPPGVSSESISGQAWDPVTQKSYPWNDPYGFKANARGGKTENMYLYCTNKHTRYSPICRTFDVGVTPSEIIANHIDQYEWEYKWRNTRLYRKFWNSSGYGTAVLNTIYESKRFLTMWGELGGIRELFRRTGIVPPNGEPVDSYYNQLIQYFNEEFSAANTISAAYHQAIINQSSGERSFATRFDSYYGDTLQQGIILDKVYSVQSWAGLAPVDNINPSQRRGSFLAPYAIGGTPTYSTVAESTIEQMVGGSYDAYPWLAQSTVAAFAHDTHDINFSGRNDIREWVGGHAFYRLDDFLAFFRDIAIKKNFQGTDTVANPPIELRCRVDSSFCPYDVRHFSDQYNTVITPDARTWTWVYLTDRNMWVAAQKEKNPTSYRYFLNYNQNLASGFEDDGGYYARQRIVKYYIDSFLRYR